MGRLVQLFGGKVRISRKWAIAYSLIFYSQLQNCPGAGSCVIYYTLMYYNEQIMRPKVYGKSDLLSSWA